jgi:hypothetical protein
MKLLCAIHKREKKKQIFPLSPSQKEKTHFLKHQMQNKFATQCIKINYKKMS